MKLKVKYSGDVRTLEVAGEPQDIILADLTNITTDLFHLQRSVVLSLNKKDALRGDELTLAQLGIVSGDLLFVLEAESSSTSPGISSEELRNIDAGAQADKQGLPASASSSACESISSSCSGGHGSSFLSPIGLLHSHSYENAGVGRENTDNCSTVANGGIPRNNTESDSQAGRNGQSKDEGGPDNLHRQHFVDEEDANVPGPSAASASLEGQNDPAFLVQSLQAQDPEVNRCLQEPLLCRESSPIAVPVMLRDLYAGAQCCKVADALWVAVHALMMEVGLRPQEDASLSMGEHWNTEGFYKRTYRHTIADARYSCAVVGIPMGGSLILHGVISGDPPFTTEKVQLRVADFVCGSGVSNDVCSVYRNLERLSRLVKDMICQPLLAQLAEECGYPVSLGLLCLSHELKLKVLSYLPACSLVRMGQVCQLFASMYCDPWLWRRLYLREFGRPAEGTTSLANDWYTLFKQKWRERLQRSRAMTRTHPIRPYWVGPYPVPFTPLVPPPYAEGIIGGDYDLNPEYSSGIPHPLFGRLGSRMPFIPHPRFDDPFGFGPPPDQPPGFGQHCDEALGFGQLARSAFGPRRNRVFNLPRMSRF